MASKTQHSDIKNNFSAVKFPGNIYSLSNSNMQTINPRMLKKLSPVRKCYAVNGILHDFFVYMLKIIGSKTFL